MKMMSLARNKMITMPEVYVTFVFVTGFLAGGFLSVAIHRLPLMMQREWRLLVAS